MSSSLEYDWTKAEFKEFKPRFKFKPPLKYGLNLRILRKKINSHNYAGVVLKSYI